ncbi:MAG: glycosyltransferase family 2 protein [Planctomycetota bacterium]|jgi:glycosyltransferase involved in cell wall biosynthesis
MLPLALISLPLLVVSGVGLVYWLIVVVRLFSGLRRKPSVRAGLDLPAPEEGWPALSIIVPAHDEERGIEQCVRSLRAQTYPDLEIIFVLDRCTDRTAELLRPHAEQDPRITIIENDFCPEDWTGKCNAARIGAEQARGDWLLFADADTIFEPELARAATAIAIDRDVQLLSLLTTLTGELLHERVAQPVACFMLLHICPMERHGRDQPHRAFANGQFMLFRRDRYDALGGHAVVKGSMLEDMEFARELERAGGRTDVLLAEGMQVCAMYDSLEAFMRGWERIFIGVCKGRPLRLRKHSWRILLKGVALPLGQLATLVAAAVWLALGGWLGALAGVVLGLPVLAALILQAVALSKMYRIVGSPRWAILLFPVGCVLVARTLTSAARMIERGEPVRWGGREYVPQPW